ncbi:hypothetical protein AB0D38_03265 [Streptomyces sp. NPDC048279]|uniref:hypothetical protein n=1 Tax=Streptomyces TaxID=1883 RepID=UPI00265A60EB|nr:hypothetical protein [Streptomyces arenae]MCG7210111.1 hypothetical protein [Streptomyces arenae]
MTGKIETVVSGDPENTYIHAAEFPVNYAQFYVLDRNLHRTVHPEPKAPGESHAGILRTVRGGAFLVTGLNSGVTDLTVSVHAREPDPLLGDYEDAVEVSLQVDTETVLVSAWEGGGKFIVLPPMPAGAGWYRLRYHARHMDQAFDLYSAEPIDAFHLQIWAEPQSDPEVLQITSNRARHWLSV